MDEETGRLSTVAAVGDGRKGCVKRGFFLYETAVLWYDKLSRRFSLGTN